MIAHVYTSPEETADKFKWLQRMGSGWKVYKLDVMGTTVYGIAYNSRDFVAMVRKRMMGSVENVDPQTLPTETKSTKKALENIDKRPQKARKTAKKPTSAKKESTPKSQQIKETTDG